MNPQARIRRVFVPAILAVLAAHAPAMGDTLKGKTFLVRSDPVFDTNAVVPDEDAKGTLSIDTRTSTGRDRLTVIATRVNKTQIYNLFVEDPESPGDFTDPPIPLTGTGTTKKLKLDTDKGDTLPYGVTSVSELEGVEVRIVLGSDPDDPATIYLSGHVPMLGASKEILRAKQKLALALNAPDANAVGDLDLSAKASNGDDRLRLKTKAIDFDSFTFSLWIEDAPGAATFSKAGDFVRKSKNTGCFQRRTRDGEPLPGGEISAAAFSGRVMEVRDQMDNPYLSVLVAQVN